MFNMAIKWENVDFSNQVIAIILNDVPVAQMDRALVYETRCRPFKSAQARQK